MRDLTRKIHGENVVVTVLSVLLLAACTAISAQAQAVDSSLSFFITGRSLGTGGNLGGLSGADAHCQQLADSVGAGGKVWRAYLSVQASGETPAVNARDRIGTGPWFNANKVMIAANVTALHDTANRFTISSANGLTHRGATVPNNQHDIVTGTKLTGLAPAAGADSTCGGWTSATTGGALVGHHNRSGITSNICQSCWNESHRTNGCTQSNLQQGGGAGYFYCFADNTPVGIDLRTLPALTARTGGGSAYAPYFLARGVSGAQVVYRFELEKQTRVEVSVFDLEGGRRAVLTRGLLGPGSQSVRWDGTDERGTAMPAGLYLIVMRKLQK
jgi:hypothetical protein